MTDSCRVGRWSNGKSLPKSILYGESPIDECLAVLKS